MDVLLALDRTSSVSAAMRAAEAAAAKVLVQTIADVGNPNNKIAVTRFGDNANGGTESELIQSFTNDYALVNTKIDTAMGSESYVGTNLEDAIEIAKAEFAANSGNAKKFLILISDGEANEHDSATENSNEGDDNVTGSTAASIDAAEEAKALGIRIITIGYDNSNNTQIDINGRSLLAAMASNSSDDDTVGAVSDAEKTAENGDGDDFYISPDNASLSVIFGQLAGVVLCDDQDPCTQDVCNPQTQVCSFPPINDDGDAANNCQDGCPLDPNKTSPGQCGCGVADTDTDGDGTADCNDKCPQDPNKTCPDVCGCGVADTNTDGDSKVDCEEECDNDPKKIVPGVCGCGVADTNADGDAKKDCQETCDNDPNKFEPGVCGCGVADTDTDGDGSPNCQDQCPNDPAKTQPGVCGCGTSDANSDGDAKLNCQETCDDDPNKFEAGACGCGVADTDTDGDGKPNCQDQCPNDPLKSAPGQCGCGKADTDTDNDGSADCNDQCDNDPSKTQPGVCGCGVADADTDQDSVVDCNDLCPQDASKTQPGQCGCGVADTDTDGDGTADCNDQCDNDPSKTQPGICGCGIADTDTDSDGTADCNDQCDNDPAKTQPGQCGCGVADTDTDGDGTADCNDQCDNDPAKTQPGVCGCDVADIDSDGDGTLNCNDLCPSDSGKVNPGVCGCGTADTDADGDGMADCDDQCDTDPAKSVPGQCGCDVADTDTDSDGTADCNDDCPADPSKLDAGICGCGVSDADTDGDGTADCNDQCPSDDEKILQGQCGCGVADTDTDGDGTFECNDQCPNDPLKTSPGACGCGTPDTDTDGDGTANCNDQCPEDSAKSVPGQCGCGVSDADTDSDGTPNCSDACPADPTRVDSDDEDGDGVEDCVDTDIDVPCTDADQDGICDDADNCVGIANPDQTDSDDDGEGDACDVTPQIIPGGISVAGGRNCSLTQGGNSMEADMSLMYYVAVVLAGIVAFRLKKSRRMGNIVMSALVSMMVLTVAVTPAWALNVQKFRPSTGQTSGLVVHTSEVLPKYHFAAGLNVNLANHPFEQTPAGSTSRLSGIVDTFVTADALVSYGATDRLTFNLDVPVNLYHNIAPTFIATRDTGGGDLGDILLSAKVQAFNADETKTGLGLAFVPFMTFPSGDEDIFFGEENVTGGMIVAGDWKFGENRIAVNAGAKFRESETVGTLNIDHELLYGLSYQRPIVKDWDLHVIAEAFGSTQLDSEFAVQDISSPLEADVTLRKKWGDNRRLVTDLGAGTAITNGYGLPNYRIFAGISYAWDLSPKGPKPKSVRIEIPSEVLFDFDKSEIKPSARPILDDFAAQTIKAAKSRVTIEGHTDSVGSDDYNMGLSKRRATSIKTYLVGKGVPAERLTAVGYGESRPVAGNETAEGRQKNRRAVFVVDND